MTVAWDALLEQARSSAARFHTPTPGIPAPRNYVGGASSEQPTAKRRRHHAPTTNDDTKQYTWQEQLHALVTANRPKISGDSSDSDLDDDDVARVRHIVYSGIPDNTAKAELSAWKSWYAACERLQLTPWRGRKTGAKENTKLARIVLDVYEHMQPRRKSDPAAKPESAFAVYLAIRRMLLREGSTSCPTVTMVRSLIKGLVVDYIERYGFRTLVPKRAAAFSAAEARQLRSLPYGSKLGRWTLQPQSLATCSWRCLNSTMFNTGMRSDEVCTRSRQAGLTKKMLTRASLVYKIAGAHLADPTRTQLQSMTDEDGLLITVRPSKTDSDGSFWCDKPIWLPYRTAHEANACKDFVHMELEHPCTGTARAKVALFANDDESPFTKHQIDSALSCALDLIGLKDKKQTYTWHSYRVTLACLLDDAGCSPEMIKKMVRWISDESLRTYIRPNNKFITFWLDKIVDGKVYTTQARDLPHVEEQRFRQQAEFVQRLGIMAAYDPGTLEQGEINDEELQEAPHPS